MCMVFGGIEGICKSVKFRDVDLLLCYCVSCSVLIKRREEDMKRGRYRVGVNDVEGGRERCRSRLLRYLYREGSSLLDVKSGRYEDAFGLCCRSASELGIGLGFMGYDEGRKAIVRHILAHYSLREDRYGIGELSVEELVLWLGSSIEGSMRSLGYM